MLWWYAVYSDFSRRINLKNYKSADDKKGFKKSGGLDARDDAMREDATQQQKNTHKISKKMKPIQR